MSRCSALFWVFFSPPNNFTIFFNSEAWNNLVDIATLLDHALLTWCVASFDLNVAIEAKTRVLWKLKD